MAQSPRHELDRTKYLKIANERGIPEAITALHHEMWRLENEAFEGREGWKPELFEKLKEYRAFSVELWDRRYNATSIQG